MADNDTHGFDRRGFLKRAAVTGAAGLGIAGATSGTAAARARRLPADRAESLLDAHADGVLSGLEDAGVLADRSDLPTDVDSGLDALVGTGEGASVVSLPDRPDELRVVGEVAAGTLTVAVRPEDGDAFAILDTGDGRLGYTVGRGWYDFETAACSCTGTKCGPYPTVGYLYECCDLGGRCDYECTCL